MWENFFYFLGVLILLKKYMLSGERIINFLKTKGSSMNILKKSLLALSLCCALPATAHVDPYFSLLPDYEELLNYDSDELAALLKRLAKMLTLITAGGELGYYFFHNPENRNSQAPVEHLLKGNFDNILDDIFNWGNVTHFNDILPGQRYKVYSTILDARSLFKVKLLIDPTRNNIKGFGLIHFCEKNMRKIVKYAAAMGITYGLLYGDLEQNCKKMLDIILNAYKNATFVATGK